VGRVAGNIVAAQLATGQITDNAVTLAKFQDIATASFLGRNTAATGDPEVLDATTARGILNVADGATNTPLTAAAPADVTKAAAAVGVATDAARADHKHDITTATAGAATPGDAATEGTATTLARSDHQHSLPAFGTGAGTFCEGNDARLSDERTANALATTGADVNVDASAPPTTNQALIATSATTATWQTIDHGTLGGLGDDDHTQYVLSGGTRLQSAAYFAEETDHINTPAAGNAELWVRNDAVQSLVFTDDAGTDLVLNTRLTKSITVENPTASENISMFYTNVAITVTQITAVIIGSTSVSFDIEHGTSRATATGTGVIGTDDVADSTTTGNITTTFNDATIPADSFVWLSTSALSGTPSQLMVTVEYTED
jgi:hypothetical protein